MTKKVSLRAVGLWALALAAGLACDPLASAQPVRATQKTLAPWYDADGFYNKPEVTLARATSDLKACRIEALRLKRARNTATPTGIASAFNADGSYNAGVSAAASGIASILFAIQDARYNGSIEQVEFRDCAVSLGYRRFLLGRDRREAFDGVTDHGFAALVAAQTPTEGSFYTGAPNDNYYDAALVTHAYENPPVPVAAAAVVVAPDPVVTDPAPDVTPQAVPPSSPAARREIDRIGAGQRVTAQEGMAIIVASARQKSAATQVVGDDFRFSRVPAEGRFLDLLQPDVSFAVRAHRNAQRRRDPTLAGNIKDPRYSTYQVPAGRYVLSAFGTLNACLGTVTFEVAAGDVAYLGDLVLQPPGLPVASLLIPMANINTGMDNNLKSDLRFAVGDELEAARHALQADDAEKAQLRRVSYQNGYRISCDGKYVGRIANPAWTTFDPAQAPAFHDAMAARVAESAP